jgi:hypothetical protein
MADDDVKPVRKVIRKIKEKYDKDPEDWKITGCNDKHGNQDTFITHPPNTFWLKSKALNPYSAISYGSVIRNLDDEINKEISKKLTPDEMLRLFGFIVPVPPENAIIASGIERFSQKKGKSLKEKITEKKKDLSRSLARKVDEEFTKRHPQRKNLYI